MKRVSLLLSIAAVLIAAAPTRSTEPALVVIVHRERQITLSVTEVASIYLKQRRFWPDGAPIAPLNHEPGSTIRERFSIRVLGQPSRAFAEYWNEQYFQGVFPPASLSSSAAVKRYVATDRNAIGYIDRDDADDSVRIVLHLP